VARDHSAAPEWPVAEWVAAAMAVVAAGMPVAGAGTADLS
jgi:hypothetical protein